MSEFLAHRGLVKLATVLGLALLSACPVSTHPPPRDPDPTVSALRALERRRPEGPRTAQCLRALARQPLCRDARAIGVRTIGMRTIGVRVALDPRYRRWPAWKKRLDATFACGNELYKQTGIRWRIARIISWDPGEQRHDLRGLLHRLRHEQPGDTSTLRLGISVWEERQIYRKTGGEIGLSQAGACVVPSWPRVENDCIILAHELGHLIGARHVPGKQWIMGWAARPFHLPSSDPLARVVAAYRFHPRNLAAVRAFRDATMTANGLRPSLACRERIRRLDRCYGF